MAGTEIVIRQVSNDRRVNAHDAIVERWNALGSHQRRKRRAECGARGHLWATVIYDGEPVYQVCRRCCETAV